MDFLSGRFQEYDLGAHALAIYRTEADNIVRDLKNFLLQTGFVRHV